VQYETSVIPRPNFLKRIWFPLTSGLICFLWAFLSWLTVIPNQDILADGIQAQSVLTDPRIVLAFPGQKHGGPLEYPATLLAEAFAPGNYYANALIRPFLAFATGFILALLFRRLFPLAPRWSFIAAIAVGPTIIHGLLGPDGNTVGVWWLQPNWDMAWLFGVSGALVIAQFLNKDRSSQDFANYWWPVLGGLFFGLGFFAHPAIILMLIPLAVLVVLRSRFSVKIYLLTILGSLVGIFPAAISYVVNAGVNTWDPSHGAFISVDYYSSMGGSVLGLNGVPDYITVLLPYGLGLSPSTLLISGTVQSILMWIFVAIIVFSSVFSFFKALRNRAPVGPGGAIALTWLSVMGTMIVFITFIDPVWIYSSGLSILFWLSVGALPSIFALRWLGTSLTIGVITLVGLSTITHNAKFYGDIPLRIQDKIDVMNEKKSTAQQLEQAGAEFVFGSYYDAIPIGYASGMSLRTITYKYNRFPLTPAELERESVPVAINTTPSDPWGEESLQAARSGCTPRSETVSDSVGVFQIFDCPPAAVDFRQ